MSLLTERPTLETPRLRLRPIVPNDAAEIVTLAGERDIAATTRFIPHPYERHMADRWIASLPGAFERGEIVNFAVEWKEEGSRFIGSIGLTINAIDRHAEMSYWIGKPFWNRGFATEAAQRVLEFAFDTLGLYRVYAHHMTRNPASGRVMQKIGLKKEGVMKDHRFKWGKYEDLAIYGATEPDYRGFLIRGGSSSGKNDSK